MKRKMMEWVVSALGSKKRYVSSLERDGGRANGRWDLLNLNSRRIRN